MFSALIIRRQRHLSPELNGGLPSSISAVCQRRNSCQGLIFNRSLWLHHHNMFKLNKPKQLLCNAWALTASQGWGIDVQGSVSTGFSCTLSCPVGTGYRTEMPLSPPVRQRKQVCEGFGTTQLILQLSEPAHCGNMLIAVYEQQCLSTMVTYHRTYYKDLQWFQDL